MVKKSIQSYLTFSIIDDLLSNDYYIAVNNDSNNSDIVYLKSNNIPRLEE